MVQRFNAQDTFDRFIRSELLLLYGHPVHGVRVKSGTVGTEGVAWYTNGEFKTWDTTGELEF